jgi:hypothetical protein
MNFKFPDRNSDKIRPEVRALVDRGNVTLDEWENFVGNSYEMELIAPKLNDEAFIYYAEHMLVNCRYEKARPWRSYNEAVMGFVAGELLRRYKDQVFLCRVEANEATLADYIRWLNAKMMARKEENPDLWGGILTDDLEHWSGYGITTAKELGEYLDECCRENAK